MTNSPLTDVKIKRFEIWLANLNPQKGTETGKVRPVLVLQSDLLNVSHPSTLICPITTNVLPKLEILRVHLKKDTCGLNEHSDVLVDQLRAVDNKRFIKKIGELPKALQKKLVLNLKIILDLDW